MRSWSRPTTSRVPGLEYNRFLGKDQFIADQDEQPLASDVDKAQQHLNPEDLALLPSRLFGYALRERAYFNLDISFIEELPQMDDPFGSLIIDQGCMTQMQALIYHHFTTKKAQGVAARQTRELMDQDFIRGK